MITQERLKELLYYHPESGDFVWLKWPAPSCNKIVVGTQAGCIHPVGYLRIMIDQRSYKAHRLAWLYVHGKWPNDQIDHANGNNADNRISNLREATNGQNQHNTVKARRHSLTGVKGINYWSARKKYRAEIRAYGKRYRLGYFDDIESAKAAHVAAANRLHKEFSYGRRAI